jgi:hypothetical protein
VEALRFWVVTQEYVEAQRLGATKFDLHGNERLRKAAALVEWAKTNIDRSDLSPWPAALPLPSNEPGQRDEQVASELFLGAIGWILLHEVGYADGAEDRGRKVQTLDLISSRRFQL